MELTKKAQKTLNQRLENTLFAIIEKENFYANARELTIEQFGDLARSVLAGEDGAAGIAEQQIFSWHVQFLGNAAIAYP